MPQARPSILELNNFLSITKLNPGRALMKVLQHILRLLKQVSCGKKGNLDQAITFSKKKKIPLFFPLQPVTSLSEAQRLKEDCRLLFLTVS